jgi:DNA helicase-2/ATP-dependent DNA helicase PcrA
VPLLDEDYLILSTIHSAKGQKWKSVYLLNVVDGCMPSDLGTGTSAEIEEERRLLYVAMTRAKDDLLWSCRSASLSTVSTRRAIVTSMPPGRASFPKLCSVCSSARLGLLCRPVPQHVWRAKGPKVDISARMRGMWR